MNGLSGLAVLMLAMGVLMFVGLAIQAISPDSRVMTDAEMRQAIIDGNRCIEEKQSMTARCDE